MRKILYDADDGERIYKIIDDTCCVSYKLYIGFLGDDIYRGPFYYDRSALGLFKMIRNIGLLK